MTPRFITTTGVGQVTVDFTLTGRTGAGAVTLGTDRDPPQHAVRVPPPGGVQLQPPADLDRRDFTALNMRTRIRA